MLVAPDISLVNHAHAALRLTRPARGAIFLALLFFSHTMRTRPTLVGTPLAKREREILDVLYRLGCATANEVLQALGSQRSYSTVRTQLRVLEEKGHVRHEVDGTRYVYVPAVPRQTARESALRHLMHTFFDGSPVHVVAALLGESKDLSEDALERIADLVEKARREGR